MTREELVTRVLNGYLDLFSEIPENFQDKDLATMWVGQGLGGLRDIPAHLIDDKIRLSAMTPTNGNQSGNVQNVVDSLSLIDPSQTDRYEEIALCGVIFSAKAIWSVDYSLLTSSFLKKALAGNSRALLPLVSQAETLKRSGIVIDQDVIDAAVSGDPSYFGFFKNHQYSEKSLRNCIKNHNFSYRNLIAIGRFDVLVEMVREGFWLHDRYEEPGNLENGIEIMMQGCLLHEAYVRQYPINEVVEHMTTPSRKDALLKMYSYAELTPLLKTTHLGQDRAFKAQLLESGLGL